MSLFAGLVCLMTAVVQGSSHKANPTLWDEAPGMSAHAVYAIFSCSYFPYGQFFRKNSTKNLTPMKKKLHKIQTALMAHLLHPQLL